MEETPWVDGSHLVGPDAASWSQGSWTLCFLVCPREWPQAPVCFTHPEALGYVSLKTGAVLVRHRTLFVKDTAMIV